MIAPALAVLVAAAIVPRTPVPTIPPDSIWGGYEEATTYSTFKNGGSKEHDLSVQIWIMTPTVVIGSAQSNERSLEMTLGGEGMQDGSDSARQHVQVVFSLKDFRPTGEIADQGSQMFLNPNGTVLYDALPAWLRGFDLTKPRRFPVTMKPTLLFADSAAVDSMPAEIEIIGPSGPPSETSHGGLQVNIRYAGKVDRMWFHPGPGHILLVWERADGTTLTYLKSERRAFK